MTTVVVEGKNSFFLASQATLITDDRELAWAERSVKPNPAYKYVLGRFVEANKANHNKQFWSLGELQMSQPSIQWAPMNMLHRPRSIVGAFVDTEIMYPMGEAADGTEPNPYIEALGVFWKWYFPQEARLIESAHALGQLFYSMECVSDSITCAGEQGCGSEFPYAGPKSTTYCAHLNQGESIKQLNKPHFLGGALIIPPEKPGWAGAAVSELSVLVAEHRLEAELAYEGFKADSPHLGPEHWHYLMEVLLAAAKTSETAAKRHKVGAKVQLSRQMGHMAPGTKGVVHNVHNGPYYGIAFGPSPIYFAPQSHVEPDADEMGGPNDMDADDPAIAFAVAAEAAMYEPSAEVKRQVAGLAAEAAEWASLARFAEEEGWEYARTFSTEQRQKLAKTGAALPDNSYPTPTLGDLDNAIKAYGRADPAKRAGLKRYLLRRARALGASQQIIDRINGLGAS